MKRIVRNKALGKPGSIRPIILCGWNKYIDRLIESLKTLSTGKKLEIVLINDQNNDAITPIENAFPTIKFRFVQGDHTREAVLHGVNLKEAAVAIILPSDRLPGGAHPDEKTMFACLSIKSLAPHLRVVAYLADRDNLAHVRRANADEVIISEDLDAYMVASHVLDPGVPETVEALLVGNSGSRLRVVEVPSEFVGKTYEALFNHFWKEQSQILVSVFSQEERIGVQEILTADTSSLDAFIERKLRQAGYRLGEESRESVVINPREDYVIRKNEKAIVIRSH